MTDTWAIEEDLWWHPSTESIRFAIINEKTRHICAISKMALNDFYQTEDTKDAAFDNFEKDRHKIISIAVELANTYEPNEDGIFFIKSGNMR